ncbi:protein ARK2N isoform X1 [Narcine bancroftii]|uniref:protein ARK2N isoform X1 n=1 Tax=Narcine bancroftii TaxID=1343680 RepID=UPI0038317EE9
MKMEAAEKADFSSHDGLEETEASSKGIDTKSCDTCKEETAVKLTKENSEHPLKTSVLFVEPCLLMDLGQDSSESQLPSADSDKQALGRTYDSDSSNQCMISPSSSGHLADSDTLSSVEENEAPQANVVVEEDPTGGSGPAIGRKSRRSRSESETSTMAPKKNRSSNDKQNGRVSKVRTQKQKERIRLLRQKREAAARKKYTLLQDSSTSDSDLTCDSSTSSSEDEVSGNGKRTISAEIPDGPPVTAHYDVYDTNSDPGVLNVDNLLAAAAVQEQNQFGHNEFKVNTIRNQGLLEQRVTGRGEENFIAADGSTGFFVPKKEEIHIASSDSEVEIVGVQEDSRCTQTRPGVIQRCATWKPSPRLYCLGGREQPQQMHSWRAISQPTWSGPPEVVDLTLDEDARRRYLL